MSSSSVVLQGVLGRTASLWGANGTDGRGVRSSSSRTGMRVPSSAGSLPSLLRWVQVDTTCSTVTALPAPRKAYKEVKKRTNEGRWEN